MKDKFYVFLDIDGTLWDEKFLKSIGAEHCVLKPESIEAVNFLIEMLSTKFDCKLIITSQRRKHWEKCKDFLHQSGLNPDIALKRTHVDDNKYRGIKVAEYMYNDLKGRSFREHKNFYEFIATPMAKFVNKKMTDYFVVIDDTIQPLKETVPSRNIIETNMRSRALDMEMVKQFLTNFAVTRVSDEMGE